MQMLCHQFSLDCGKMVSFETLSLKWFLAGESCLAQGYPPSGGAAGMDCGQL